MNKKFKTNLIAILAIFSGTSCGTCFAVQDSYAVGGVQAVEYTSGEAGVPAVNQSAYYAKNEFPPIVSSGEPASRIELPIIASAGQAKLPPIERPSDFPPIVQTSSRRTPTIPTIERPSDLPPIVQTSSRRTSTSPGADAFEIPASQMSLPMQVQSDYVQHSSEQSLMPMGTTGPLSTPSALEDPQSFQVDATPTNSVRNTSLLAPISGDDLVESGQDNDQAMALPTTIQTDVKPQAPDQTEIQQAAQWGPQSNATKSVSSAGVSLYADRPMTNPPIFGVSSNTPPPIVTTSPPSVNVAPPIVGSGSQPFFRSVSAPPAMIPNEPVMTDQAYLPAETAYNQHYFSAPAVEAPVVTSTQNCSGCGGSGCSDCGIAAAVGGNISNCDSCGTGGCFSPGSVSSRFGACGSVSDARRYLHAELLYFDRSDGTISNSNFGSLNDFDWNTGWRITFGAKSDALRGREISYMGIMPVEQSVTRTDAAARINARFTSNDGFTGAETSAFRNAVVQTEFKETQIHSVEYNQVTWGWDVIKSFAGFRYFYIDDRYMMTSLNNVAEIGTFEMSTRNHLFGPHIGGELFYDVGYRWSYSMAGKAGVYANVNSVDTKLFNNGAQFMDVQDDSATVSTSLELNLLTHYQLSRSARLRLGYNFLWVGDVASVSDNFNPALSPTAGTNSGDDDDMLFHGPSFGIEIFR